MSNESFVFPSPYWGLFFYRTLENNTLIVSVLKRFRPRTGDYFFINRRGLMKEQTHDAGFRPRTGDYFFILYL